MEIKITKFTFIIISFIFSIVKGDVDNITAFTKLIGRNANNYLLPLGTVMGTNMNNGYFRKASPHKLLGFDFTVDVSYTLAPVDQTTYDFYIPEDSVGFSFPFKFPKNLLAPTNSELYNSIPSEGNESLYKDRTIDFGLSLQDILQKDNEFYQNFFGDTKSGTIGISLDKAILAIFDQVIDESWDLAKDIPGIGVEYYLEYQVGDFIIDTTLSPLYDNKSQFKSEFGDTLRSLIVTGLSDSSMIEKAKIPIPGGAFASLKSLLAESIPLANLIPNGLPNITLQASLGLPFHTELTVRGLPEEICLSNVEDKNSKYNGKCNFSTQYGGFGGKIGISEFFKKKSKKQKPIQTEKINFVLEQLPTDITPVHVADAITDLKLKGVDVTKLDSLNFQFQAGYSMAIYDIRNQLEVIANPPKRNKTKGLPIDISLGYYRNNIKLLFLNKLGGYDGLESYNSIALIQAGKTFNFPWINWLAGIGIYGGVGFEKSSLSVNYVYTNNYAYGCFSVSDDPATYEKTDGQGNDYTESSCTSNWETGVPKNIGLDLPGENKIRSLIGARLRVLFIDIFMDKNFGRTDSYNIGIGITFR